jgi:hypothetical protein
MSLTPQQIRRLGRLGLSGYNLDGQFTNHVRWIRLGQYGPTVWYCGDIEAYDAWPTNPLIGVSLGKRYVAICGPAT